MFRFPGKWSSWLPKISSFSLGKLPSCITTETPLSRIQSNLTSPNFWTKNSVSWFQTSDLRYCRETAFHFVLFGGRLWPNSMVTLRGHGSWTKIEEKGGWIASIWELLRIWRVELLTEDNSSWDESTYDALYGIENVLAWRWTIWEGWDEDCC